MNPMIMKTKSNIALIAAALASTSLLAATAEQVASAKAMLSKAVGFATVEGRGQPSTTFFRSGTVRLWPSPVVPHTNAPLTPFLASALASGGIISSATSPSWRNGVNGAATSPDNIDFMSEGRGENSD